MVKHTETKVNVGGTEYRIMVPSTDTEQGLRSMGVIEVGDIKVEFDSWEESELTRCKGRPLTDVRIRRILLFHAGNFRAEITGEFADVVRREFARMEVKPEWKTICGE